MRKLIVPKSRKTAKRKEDSKTHKSIEELASQGELIAPLTWAQRLKRVFERAALGSTLRPLCGGTMRVIADITDPDLIQKILGNILQHNHHPLNVQPLANPKTFADKQPNQLCAEQKSFQ
jgi:hypothetical protein